MECEHEFYTNDGSETMNVCKYCNIQKHEILKGVNRYVESPIINIIKYIFGFKSYYIVEKSMIIYEDIDKKVNLRGMKRLKCILGTIYMVLYLLDEPLSQDEYLIIVNNNSNNKYNFNKTMLHHSKKYIRENIRNIGIFNSLSIFDDSTNEYILNMLYSAKIDINYKLILNHYKSLYSKHKETLCINDEKTIAVFVCFHYSSTYGLNEFKSGIDNLCIYGVKVSKKSLYYLLSLNLSI